MKTGQDHCQLRENDIATFWGSCRCNACGAFARPCFGIFGSLGPARDAVFKWQLFAFAIAAIGKNHVFQSVPRFQSVILRPESVSMWDGATSCICPTVPPAVPEAGSFQKKVEQLASKVEGNVRPKAGASWHFHGIFCFALKPCWASHMSRDRISKIVSWLFMVILIYLFCQPYEYHISAPSAPQLFYAVHLQLAHHARRPEIRSSKTCLACHAWPSASTLRWGVGSGVARNSWEIEEILMEIYGKLWNSNDIYIILYHFTIQVNKISIDFHDFPWLLRQIFPIHPHYICPIDPHICIYNTVIFYNHTQNCISIYNDIYMP